VKKQKTLHYIADVTALLAAADLLDQLHKATITKIQMKPDRLGRIHEAYKIIIR
jgi:hypothetical protein